MPVVTTVLSVPRVRIPRSARAGETIEIRTLIEHPMETGLRHDGSRGVPREMLTRLQVRMNGETVLVAEFRNGSSANPYHVFFVRIERTSSFDFTWTDDRGRVARAESRVVAI
jgi:sulfur-oxidizing protein SoxZ